MSFYWHLSSSIFFFCRAQKNIWKHNSWWSPLTSILWKPKGTINYLFTNFLHNIFFYFSSACTGCQLAVAHIKFEVLMLAYKTTTHHWHCTNILKLNSSDLRALPQKLCVLQVNNASWCHPKEAHNHSHRPFPGLFPAGGTTCLSQSEQLNL